MTDYMKITGLSSTVRALRVLPKEFASTKGGPVRKALYKATEVIRQMAQAKAPVDTGALKANIYIWRDRNPQATGATERFHIMVRSKKRRNASRTQRKMGHITRHYNRNDVYYWHFVEFGVPANPKYPAQPYMKPAFEAGKGLAIFKFADVLRRNVYQAVQQARGRAGVKP